MTLQRIKLPLSKLSNPEFCQAFRSLSLVSFPDFNDNYAIARSFKKIETALAAFNKSRRGLIESFGTTEDKKTYTIAPDKLEEFNAANTALEAQEVELYLDHQLKLPAGNRLSGMDLVQLWGSIIEEPADEVAPTVEEPTKA
jgi:hypothetical protein